MKIQLSNSLLLTDENAMAAEGKPVLIDLETRKIHHPGDRIMGVSAQQMVPLVFEARGENISCRFIFMGFLLRTEK